MTYQEVANMLAEITLNGVNVPFAYLEFKEGEAVAPPFICYLYNQNTPEPADNVNYVKIEQLAIEVYSDTKDFALEAEVERVLNKYELVYYREETFLDDEQLQMVTYTTEVHING